MSFLFSKWKELSHYKKTREMYGENSSLIMRSKRPEPSKNPTHSFPHLLKKKIDVPQYNLPKFDELRGVFRSYGISDAEKARMASRYTQTPQPELSD